MDQDPIELAKKISILLKTNPDYIIYEKAKKDIENDVHLNEKINAYREAQLCFHNKILQGIKPPFEEEKNISNLYTSLTSDEKTRNFILHEKLILDLLNEIYVIIGSSISINLGK